MKKLFLFPVKAVHLLVSFLVESFGLPAVVIGGVSASVLITGTLLLVGQAYVLPSVKLRCLKAIHSLLMELNQDIENDFNVAVKKENDELKRQLLTKEYLPKSKRRALVIERMGKDIAALELSRAKKKSALNTKKENEDPNSVSTL
jgi:hypothetical protein